MPLSQKRLELLKVAIPSISRIAVLLDALSPANVGALSEAQQAAKTLGVQLQSLPVRTPEDYQSAFEGAKNEHGEGMLIMSGPMLDTHRAEVTDLTRSAGLPSISDEWEYADLGRFMAYGPNLAAFYYRAAYFVDRILKGTNLPTSRSSSR